MQQVSERTISYPFTIGPNGSVQDTTSQEKIWADRVLSVLGTCLDERVYRSEFGASLYTQEFYGDVNSGIDNAKLIIANAFNKFLPLLSLVRVTGSQDTSSGTLTLNIQYKLPNQTLVNTTTSAISLNGNYPPSE